MPTHHLKTSGVKPSVDTVMAEFRFWDWHMNDQKIVNNETATYILMGQYKKDVTQLLMHWIHIFLALTHQYYHLVMGYITFTPNHQKYNFYSNELLHMRPSIVHHHLLTSLLHANPTSPYDISNSTAVHRSFLIQVSVCPFDMRHRGLGYADSLWPLLLTWFNFNSSMDK